MSAATTKSTKPKASAKKVADHPTYLEMVRAAIVNLKERGGSSRQAIKKYIHESYKGLSENADKLINTAIKSGVDKGVFVQPKGASGPLKLKKKETEEKPEKAPKKAAGEKKAAPKKAAAKVAAVKKQKDAPKKAVKKAAGEKKAAAPKKAAAEKKAAPKKAAAEKKAAPKKSAKKAAADKA
ncbi:protein HIL-5 [Polychytrium aggregatum]|uniref:protein HIL-5 n=1 Tax=Polychytrium aggregatum TaxID=110093 RepID=UPI0022FE0C8E|nr:protein HIL-5 [Polychytrium aggregatum]KAI9206109.1 protein HIL-5 [Polychytrium aggregatum]